MSLIRSGLFVAANLWVAAASGDDKPAKFNAGKNESTSFAFHSIRAPIPATDNSATKAALKEAVVFLTNISPSELHAMERCRLWASIAALSTKLGDRDGAKKAIAHAVEASSELKDRRELELRTIGKEWGRLGEAAQVIELVKPVPGTGHPRETILQESAFAAAEMGHDEAAKRIAEELPKEKSEWIFSEIKRLHFLFRSKSGITEDLLKEIDALPSGRDRIVIFAGRVPTNPTFMHLELKQDSLVEREIARGDIPSAKAIAQRALKSLPTINDSSIRRYCVFLLARAFALLEEPASIREAIKLLPPDPAEQGEEFRIAEMCRLQIMSLLAATEARAKNDAKAQQIVLGFKEYAEQGYVMMYIGLGQYKSGFHDASKQSFVKAQQLMDHSTPATRQYHHELASALAMCGDFEASLKSAKASLAFGNIAHMMAKAGEFEDARELIEKVDTKWWQGMGLRYIAQLQTKAGQEKETRKWIAREKDPIRKAYAMVGFAEGLYVDKEAQRAK